MQVMSTLGASNAARHHKRMKKAFELVSDPLDWRAPIDKTVEAVVLGRQNVTIHEIKQAVAYFLGVEPEVKPVSNNGYGYSIICNGLKVSK